jgi:phosphoribosylanthranilate isomerase
MLLKICGITNRPDAEAAAAAGATALGFNFYRLSPRYIPPEAAGQIADDLPILKVGVFVNESPTHIAAVARLAHLDVIQLHGDESPADYPPGLTIWKAARVTPAFQLADYAALPVEALLLDGPSGPLYGGAGLTFDWSLAAQSPKKIILAGGLDASNVRDAILQAHPWGVDACSRIESKPGRKDHVKMREFIQAAKAAFSC